MKLTEKPDEVTWSPTYYVYTEKVGPFMETAMKAWQEVHQVRETFLKSGLLTGAFAMYKMKPQNIYRAGFKLSAKPEKIPDGFKCEKIDGGKYARFVLTGSYSNLPQASGTVHDILAKTQMPLRDDFFIENYANDPSTTPEDQLITEILAPKR